MCPLPPAAVPQIDCVTPLCSQFTYEGLIDEMYGITLGMFCSCFGTVSFQVGRHVLLLLLSLLLFFVFSLLLWC